MTVIIQEQLDNLATFIQANVSVAKVLPDVNVNLVLMAILDIQIVLGVTVIVKVHSSQIKIIVILFHVMKMVNVLANH